MSGAVASDLVSFAYFGHGSSVTRAEWTSAAGGTTVTIPAAAFYLTIEGTTELVVRVYRQSTATVRAASGWYAVVPSTAAISPDQVFFGPADTAGYGSRDLGIRLTGSSTAISGDLVIKTSLVDMAVFPAASP